MDIARATVEQIDAVEAVVAQCREELEARDILQWDALYPDRAFFEQACAADHLFVLTEAEAVTGVVVLDERQAREWDTVVWQEGPGPYLVVHALAVLPSSQGKGYGSALLAFCEAFAMAEGYGSVRLDAFSENAAALRFYERHGYALQGAIDLAFKPVGHRRYCCYEKRLTRTDVRKQDTET
jgi:ribosomal protein S18 acetylase RimI-like enzyme